MNSDSLITDNREDSVLPSFNHGYFQLSIGIALRQQEKFSVVSASSIEINHKEYIPDISVYAKRKVDRLHDIVKMTELPLLAIEIISPTQGSLELINKFNIYFEGGIKSCWLVDPLPASVVVFSSPDKAQTFTSGEVIDDVVDMRVPIDELFK
jgi:Uma2 family endonuclease